MNRRLVPADSTWLVAELLFGTLICLIPAATVGEVSDTTIRIGVLLTTAFLIPLEVVRHLGPAGIRRLIPRLNTLLFETVEPARGTEFLTRRAEQDRYPGTPASGYDVGKATGRSVEHRRE